MEAEVNKVLRSALYSHKMISTIIPFTYVFKYLTLPNIQTLKKILKYHQELIYVVQNSPRNTKNWLKNSVSEV